MGPPLQKEKGRRLNGTILLKAITRVKWTAKLPGAQAEVAGWFFPAQVLESQTMIEARSTRTGPFLLCGSEGLSVATDVFFWALAGKVKAEENSPRMPSLSSGTEPSRGSPNPRSGG